MQIRDEIQFAGLPLMVYEEIATHLRQVEGVATGLYTAQSEQFDYNQSQVGGLWIQYAQTDEASREQVAQILAYYQNRYGADRGENSQV